MAVKTVRELHAEIKKLKSDKIVLREALIQAFNRLEYHCTNTPHDTYQALLRVHSALLITK
jgi:cell division protein FtsB